MIINTYIPNFETEESSISGVAVITAFNNRKLDVFIKENVPDYGFYGTNQTYSNYLSLTEFDDNVKTIGSYAFYNQSAMQIADFNKVEYIGGNAFTNCKNLTIPIMNNVKTIAAQSFVNCSSLLELNLPKIEDIQGAGSATSTFSGCSVLEKVVLGESIKSLSSGNARVFQGNNALTTINLPASLETVATYAFYNCPNLTNITVGEGFNVTLNLGLCGDLTQETLETIITNYADASGKKLTVTSSTYTLATENLFTGSELTIAEYASAKGLTLASS